MNLPTREQCEGWTPTQLANYLSQIKMWECGATVQKLKIDGHRFLHLSDSDLSKFSLIHRPQLQKMVQDIKKNDDSLFNRFRRFQNEQTANIIKTGRNTLDRMKKNKVPPKLPARDYQGGDNEKPDQFSDCDSDMYEDPQVEADDNYEPPPSERPFRPTPSVPYPRGEYLESRHSRPNPRPSKNRHPNSAAKPPLPPKGSNSSDDEDYIEPEGEQENQEDDNYIDPTEKSSPSTTVNRVVKPRVASLKPTQDVYEVPDVEETHPAIQQSDSHLRAPLPALRPVASPRLHVRKPAPDPETDEDDEYEVCDADEGKKTEEPSVTSIPTPLPRDRKISNPPVRPPKPGNSSKENEVRRPSVASATSTPSSFFRPKMPLPPRSPAQKPPVERSPENGARGAEEDAGVYLKVWYASSCDRRKAEDALIRTDKDGAYLVRKSSGQDALQPYTLVVFYNGRVYNIPVRYIPASQQYALGKEKAGEERFSSVSQIIENHQKNPLVLIDSVNNTKDSTNLKHAVKP